MSVESEIQRIKSAKADLKTAINSKGGELSAELINAYAAAVNDIRQATGAWITDNGDTSFVGEGVLSIPQLIKELIIPSGYTSIADGLLQASPIQEIVLPESIRVLGSNYSASVGVFRDCAHLRSVQLNNGLETIGRYTFYGCTALVGELVLPQSLISIYMRAFLEQATIFNGLSLANLKLLDQYAFAECANLTGDVVLPSLETIGVCALRHTNISRVLNLGQITTITRVAGGAGDAYGTFGGCIRLTEVHLPSTFIELRASTFYGCTSLTDVYVDATTPPSLENINAFAQCPLEHIYVPAESVEAYKAATNWSNFENIITANPNS